MEKFWVRPMVKREAKCLCILASSATGYSCASSLEGRVK
jgi:hypothetical protein